MSAAAVITPQTFKLADRMKIQDEIIRAKQYVVIGRLTALVWEGQGGFFWVSPI